MTAELPRPCCAAHRTPAAPPAAGGRPAVAGAAPEQSFRVGIPPASPRYPSARCPRACAAPSPAESRLRPPTGRREAGCIATHRPRARRGTPRRQRRQRGCRRQTRRPGALRWRRGPAVAAAPRPGRHRHPPPQGLGPLPQPRERQPSQPARLRAAREILRHPTWRAPPWPSEPASVTFCSSHLASAPRADSRGGVLLSSLPVRPPAPPGAALTAAARRGSSPSWGLCPCVGSSALELPLLPPLGARKPSLPLQRV
mmetsp:Transcript_21969/g.65817  ORF Transcript_21969/g.65817 Transcript_21969/m.65817 type:complete len:256 (+) Transcript_21969:3022-3789(+)